MLMKRGRIEKQLGQERNGRGRVHIRKRVHVWTMPGGPVDLAAEAFEHVAVEVCCCELTK